MLEITGDLLLASAALLIWLGRMSKRTMANPDVQFVTEEVVVEKKVEVPTVVYKCQQHCVQQLAERLYDQISVNEYCPDSHIEQIELEDKHAESMEKCLRMAIELHAQPAK